MRKYPDGKIKKKDTGTRGCGDEEIREKECFPDAIKSLDQIKDL
jgi:hypothetical protein